VLEKKKRRPSYSSEFKREAVAKYRELGPSRTSKELGVSPITLRNWMLKEKSIGLSKKGSPSYDELEKENRKLRKELGYVTEINEVLKKSTAIFSSKELGGLR